MMAVSARRSLNLLQSQWSNKNLNLWTLEEVGLSLITNQSTYALPAGTVDVIQCLLRTNTRPSGTATSTAGGTAANAFDNDLDTACTQTAPNGRIYLDYGEGATATIQMVGLRVAADISMAVIYEYSSDLVTWTEAVSVAETDYDSATTAWTTVPAPFAARYFSIRAEDGATLNVTEAIWITNLVDTTLGRIAISDYFSVGQKNTPGRPSAFDVNRLIAPTLVLYPPPISTYTLAVYKRIRHLYDVTSATETFDVPQRFLEAITADLALHLARKFAPARKADLQADADAAWMIAAAEDRDRAPLSFTPDLTGWA